jgi:hypothetical protein
LRIENEDLRKINDPGFTISTSVIDPTNDPPSFNVTCTLTDGDDCVSVGLVIVIATEYLLALTKPPPTTASFRVPSIFQSPETDMLPSIGV